MNKPLQHKPVHYRPIESRAGLLAAVILLALVCLILSSAYLYAGEPAVNAQWLSGTNIPKWLLVGAGGLGLLWIQSLRRMVRNRTKALQDEIELRCKKEQELQENMERMRDAHQKLALHVQRMPLAYIVWDKKFRIAEWNPAAERIFGWAAAEVVGRCPYELLGPSEIQPRGEEAWSKLLIDDGSNVLVNENLRKDGAKLTCEWHNTPLRNASGEMTGVLSMVKDITDRLRSETYLRKMAEGLSVATGEAFFHSLVQNLAELLDVDYALIGELVGESLTRVRSIAMFGHGRPMENFECELAGTPCADVVISSGSELCIHPSRIREKFPFDKMLAEMGVEGYIGTPLRNATGNVMGIIAIMKCRPLEKIDEAVAMFQAFAVRVSAELERRQAEQALQESEQRYRIIAEQTGQLVYDYEMATGRVIWEGAIEQVTGFTQAEFVVVDYFDWVKMIHPDDRDEAKQSIEKAKASIGRYVVEYRFRRKDAKYILILHRGIYLADADGKACRMLGTMADITEQKNAEHALRDAVLKYRIVADNTYDLEFWISPDDRLLYISPSCRRITGYDAEEFIADPDLLLRIMHPDDLPIYNVHRESARRENEGELEFRIIRKDGSIRWLHHLCQPVFDDKGMFKGSRGNNRDITRRKQAEEALKTQFNQISTIFDALNALVYVSDMDDYRLLYMNKYGASTFGSDWQDKLCYEVLQKDQAGQCSFCTNDLLIRDGAPLSTYTWEFQNTVTGRWFQCIDKAIHWIDGRLVRMEIAVDITEHKELERMKDDMISAVSHEMRTPLTAMLGFTEFMIENEVPPEEQKAYLRTIHHETLRLENMVSNFLDMQRLNAKRQSPTTVPIAIEELVTEAASLYRTSSKKHRLITECDPSLPPILGDFEQLHHVLSNLISNAIKYSPDGGTITVDACRKDDSIVVWVRDEGIGIQQEELKRIFNRFYRVKNAGRSTVSGAGLGLALVQEIVTDHKGRIWVESTPGKGSTFFVSLPIAV